MGNVETVTIEREKLKNLARLTQRTLADAGCTPVEATFALALSLAEAVRQSDAHLPDVLKLVRSMHASMQRADAIVGGPSPSVDVVSPEAFARLARKVGI